MRNGRFVVDRQVLVIVFVVFVDIAIGYDLHDMRPAGRGLQFGCALCVRRRLVGSCPG